MAEFNYWAFRTNGSPEVTLQRISTYVQEHNLRRLIPRVCHEKLSRKRGRREFYIFLATTPEVESHSRILELVGHPLGLGSPLTEPLTYEAIKKMTGAEYDLEKIDFARHIQYCAPEVIKVDHPFDLSPHAQPDEQKREAYNHLLYWLSAKGTGSWQEFRQTCTILKLDQNAEPRHIFRRLRLLGHIEYLDSGNRWAICPPCLVEADLPDSVHHYFLTGMRVPQLQDTLLRAAAILPSISTQADRGAPDIMRLTFATSRGAELATNKTSESGYPLRFAGKAGMRLLQILPNIKGWMSDILHPISIPTSRYKIEKWDGTGFYQWVSQPTEPGMYRMTDSQQQEKDLTYYYFYDLENGRWLQGDWYGLRYLANVYLGLPAQLLYNQVNRLLFVPDIYRLPDIYERVLTLASGELPYMGENGVIFQNISEPLAQTLTSQLTAQLVVSDHK